MTYLGQQWVEDEGIQEAIEHIEATEPPERVSPKPVAGQQ